MRPCAARTPLKKRRSSDPIKGGPTLRSGTRERRQVGVKLDEGGASSRSCLGEHAFVFDLVFGCQTVRVATARGRDRQPRRSGPTAPRGRWGWRVEGAESV